MRRFLLALGLLIAASGGASAACVTLPYTLTNGTIADATQVMSNFSAITGCINTPATLFGNETANTGFFGPVSGGAATPTFRALVQNDLPSTSLPHVATNVALAAATTAQYPNGVWRDDYASSYAPPLLFKPLTGTCATNGVVNDGGNCVNDSSGNSWSAHYSAAGIDVREYGAVPATDITTPTQAALNSAFLPLGPIGAGAKVLIPFQASFSKLALYPGQTLICGGSANVLTRNAIGPGVYLTDAVGNAYPTTNYVNHPSIRDCSIDGGGLAGTNAMIDATESPLLINDNFTNTAWTGAQFGGSISGTALTSGSVNRGTIAIGQMLICQGCAASATFVATGSGTTLTVASVSSGYINVGVNLGKISGTGVPVNTYLVSQSSGTPGGTGVYVTSKATTSGANIISSGNTYLTILSGSGNNWVLSSPGLGTIATEQMVTAPTWTWTDANGDHLLPSANLTFMGSTVDGVFDGKYLTGFVGGTYNFPLNSTCNQTSAIGIYIDSTKPDGGNKFNQNRLESIYTPCNLLGLFVANGSDNTFTSFDFEFNTLGTLLGTGANNASRNLIEQPYFEGVSGSPVAVAVLTDVNASGTRIVGEGSLSFVTNNLSDNGPFTVWDYNSYQTYRTRPRVDTGWGAAALDAAHSAYPRLSGAGYFANGANGTSVEIGALAWGGGTIADISCGLARGTNGSPAQVAAGDVLCRHGGFGQYDTTLGHYGMAAAIDIVAAAGWSASNFNGKIVFSTVPGSSTTLTTRWTIDTSGGMWAAGLTDPGTGGINATILQTNATNFASLAACTAGREGSKKAVLDSTTVVWGATITGSGTNHVEAYCDGTSWTVSSK